MAFRPRRITLTAGTAQRLNSTAGDSTSGQSVMVVPQSSATFMIVGGTKAEAEGDEGARMPAGVPATFELDAGEQVWATCDNGTLNVDLLEGGI